MNKSRRQAITTVVKEVSKVLENLEVCYSTLLDIIQEEGEALDNTPENLQDTDRYQEQMNTYDELENVGDELEEVKDSLDEWIENINTLNF